MYEVYRYTPNGYEYMGRYTHEEVRQIAMEMSIRCEKVKNKCEVFNDD